MIDNIFVNTFLFILYFYLIFFSVLGYGIVFSKIFKINFLELSIGIVGFLGVFFLTFISYLTNLILAHDFIHNLFILLLGLIFICHVFYKSKIFKKEIFKILLITIFYIIGLFISKNSEDFSYYHLASVVNLTENKIQFGLANFNSGFGTQSSIFYFISLLYFPIIEYYLFNIHSLLILIFSSFFFLDIFFFKKVIKNNFINILSLLLFAFISIIFANLSAYGTDRAGQIIVFVVFLILFDSFSKKKFFLQDIKVLLVLIVYILTIKSYFLSYALILPLIYLRFKKNFTYDELLKNSYFIFLLFSYLSLYFFINLANTGCLIFPLSITCFPNLFWSVSLEGVINLNYWFELWAKSGATPNYVVDNKIEYIKNFNWVSNWFNNYFLGKGIDTIGSIISIILVFLLIFKFTRTKQKKKIIPSGLFYLYLILIIFLFIWFNKHPDLRYGGYSIVTLLFFIPASIYLSQFQIFYKNKNFIIFFIILIIIAIFNIRNNIRIISEFKRDDLYKFSNFPFFSKKYLERGVNLGFADKRILIRGYNFYYQN
jgi:hypothetical protein